MTDDLSEHFSRSQFVCPCCHEAKMNLRLISALEKLHSLAGAEIEIVCGYRCVKANRHVRGPSRLAHMQGRAADIRIRGRTLSEILALAERVAEFRNGGIAINDDRTLHVDVRTFRARWWRSKGVYHSGEAGS